MAFRGYLVKIGDYTFPNEYILLDTYKPIKSVQDLDSYRDSNGVLHRNALEHNLYKVEFQIRAMTNTQFDDIMNNIRSRYTIPAERKTTADFFIPEIGAYTGLIDVYIPDPEVTIYQIIDSETVKYDAITLKLIAY